MQKQSPCFTSDPLVFLIFKDINLVIVTFVSIIHHVCFTGISSWLQLMKCGLTGILIGSFQTDT